MTRTTPTQTTGPIAERPPTLARRGRRAGVTALVAATVLAASVTAASAATPALVAPSGSSTGPVSASPSSAPTASVDGETVTITVDLATMQRLCARAPATTERLTGLVERIQSGPDVPGSSAWLTARADAASTAGRGALADRLTTRAERRADRVPELEAAVNRVEQARTTLCSALPDAP